MTIAPHELYKLARDIVQQTWVAKASELPAFRWLPGMRGIVPGRDGFARCVDTGTGACVWQFYSVDSVDSVDGWEQSDLVPDLNDGPTRGGLLQLIRDAWGDPEVCVAKLGDRWLFLQDPGRWPIEESSGRRYRIDVCTESAALADALKYAPRLIR